MPLPTQVTPLRVLLVEDNLDDAELLIDSLQCETQQSIDITCVPKLQAAFESLTKLSFDAVLLDLSLPDSLGMESLVKLRKFSTEIPVVVLTGIDDQELAIECVKNGAQDYLVKGRPSQGSIYRAIAYAVERNRAESAIKQLKLLEQREHFIAMLAHDLRSPIHGSDRIINMVLDGLTGPISEKQNHLLSIISSTNKTLLLMINNVLDAYRLEAGGETLQLAQLDLPALIGECLADLEPVAQGKNIHVSRALSCANFVYADAMAMRRVILNLVNNAIKFTPAGGSIEVSLKEKAGCAVLTVKDNGIGIKQEQLAHLFERFYQADHKNRATGLGLGLHLCKHLIDAQNGSITCNSKLNDGASFEVTLPLVIKPSVKALIVDDNEINRITLEKILKFLNIESIAVTNGHDALKAVSEHSFTAVFMDLQMPGLDGFDTSKAMRDAGVTVPIVAYTGFAQTDKKRFEESGIIDILQKPIDIERVKIMFDHLISETIKA